MYAVILCGGSGTRLWPLSRRNYPKQFLRLYSDHSLLQETYLRMRKLVSNGEILFVTNQGGYPHVLEQIWEIDRSFDPSHVIIEPESLNTAPAMACAVKFLLSELGAPEDEPVIFLPSDHFIGNEEGFIALLESAVAEVGDDIGTIGIKPTGPETGYGYIRKGESLEERKYRVEEFCEKPDRKTAEGYLESGEYSWNSGMYLLTSRTFMREVGMHASEIAATIARPWEEFLSLFGMLPSISFDYAVSEKSDRVVVFPGDFGWSDIGSFDSLSEITSDDTYARHIGIDSAGVFVKSESGKLITTIGVDDMLIIESADSILVCKKGRSEEVKKIVDMLKESDAKELNRDVPHSDS